MSAYDTMRHALLDIHALLGAYVRHEILAESLCLRIKNEINAALATPPRNCDVGSMAEQRQRFHAYCEKMQNTDKACCGGCPIVKLRLDGTIGNSCELAWAQMPYEESEDKDEQK